MEMKGILLCNMAATIYAGGGAVNTTEAVLLANDIYGKVLADMAVERAAENKLLEEAEAKFIDMAPGG